MSAGVDRTRPFTASGRGSPPDPVVRPADNLLVSLDLDPPSATKMVSEVGCKDEFSGELHERKTRDDEVDNDLIEADLFGREYVRPKFTARDTASVGPGIPHVGALWNDSTSPVVLFRGSRSAPVERDCPAYSTVGPEQNSEQVPRSASQHTADDHAVENNRSLAREAQFQALIADTAHQLRNLGYDWDDIRDYHQAPNTPKSYRAVTPDVGAAVVDRMGVLPVSYKSDCASNCRSTENAMQPLEIQQVVLPSLTAGDRQCHLRQTSSETSGGMKRQTYLNETATEPTGGTGCLDRAILPDKEKHYEAANF